MNMEELAHKLKSKIWLYKKPIEKLPPDSNEVVVEQVCIIPDNLFEETLLPFGSAIVSSIADPEDAIVFQCYAGENCKENDTCNVILEPQQVKHTCGKPEPKPNPQNVGSSWSVVNEEEQETCLCNRLKKISFNQFEWHSKCFRCSSCASDVRYKQIGFRDNRLFCKACYDEAYIDVCSICLREILEVPPEGMRCDDKIFHKECLECAKCKNKLIGKRFQARKDQFYCTACLVEIEKKCQTCKKIIEDDDKFVFFDDTDVYWHDDCFRCSFCKSSLRVDETTVTVYDRRLIKCMKCERQTALAQSPKVGVLEMFRR